MAVGILTSAPVLTQHVMGGTCDEGSPLILQLESGKEEKEEEDEEERRGKDRKRGNKSLQSLNNPPHVPHGVRPP